MEIAALTDIGKHRKRNEDNVRAGKAKDFVYAVVADGMGGHKAGEIASEMAVEFIENRLLELDLTEENIVNEIKSIYIDVNSKIYKHAEENQKVLGMGTTAVLAIIFKKNLYIANVGDSRAYMIHKNTISQVSKDHSYVQQLVDSGVITKEQAMNHPKRNYITRAMGTDESVKTDVYIKKYKGEIVLLCSDGLCGLVTDKEILDVVNKSKTLEEAVRNLVDTANQKGGTDNITVASIRN